jgi:hypothetical protein
MTSVTFKTYTEYWMTAKKLISDNGAWLAIFLWVKSSPGFKPTI